jgi:hypothetical protein
LILKEKQASGYFWFLAVHKKTGRFVPPPHLCEICGQILKPRLSPDGMDRAKQIRGGVVKSPFLGCLSRKHT